MILYLTHQGKLNINNAPSPKYLSITLETYKEVVPPTTLPGADGNEFSSCLKIFRSIINSLGWGILEFLTELVAVWIFLISIWIGPILILAILIDLFYPSQS